MPDDPYPSKELKSSFRAFSPKVFLTPAKKEKTLISPLVSTGKRLKRVPPPNFMIGMRDLRRVYVEDNKRIVVQNRNFSISLI